MDRLETLRAYVRLVELGSFSAVADELHVKQSTISKRIAALERELDVDLVERTTRAQRVTEAGERFYARAKTLLADYASACEEVTQTAHAVRPRGKLRVSAPVVFGRLYVLPPLVRFLRRHPEVELELSLDDRYVNLVEREFDVAIRVGVPADSSFRRHKLGDSARHLVASPTYLEAAPPLQRPRDLAQHACLLHTGHVTGTTWSFRRGPKRHRATVRGRHFANNSEALRAMARAGLGVTLLAEWLVRGDLLDGRLISLLPEYAAPPAPIHALTPPGRHTSPNARALVAFLALTGIVEADPATPHGS